MAEHHADHQGPGSVTPVALSGLDVVSGYGWGSAALRDAIAAGVPAFAPISRFDVGRARVKVAATLTDDPPLRDGLAGVISGACAAAGLNRAQRATTPLLLAVHSDPEQGRVPPEQRPAHRAGELADALAAQAGLATGTRTYTSACVAASTALADGAALINAGRADRVVVAAGYLVEPDQFALFDAGRALATDGAVRPFSAGRTGLLLGDALVAVVLEARAIAGRRRSEAMAWLSGWGRAGDGYHPCQPRPDGTGLARAITAALGRAGIDASRIDYVKAHGSGSVMSDEAESHALHAALGEHAAAVPVSSTKSLHGQALEASPLLELAAAVLSLQAGRLPINAGYLGEDPQCPLRLVLDADQARLSPSRPRHALALNAAFGGANTALVVSTP